MRIIILLSLMLLARQLNAQEVRDTIYANEHKNVALFFPNPIRQSIVGASNFVFTYNREQGQYFGLLQAAPGRESNLLTVTQDGRVYSFILKYADRLPKMNYFLDIDESIGKERPDREIQKSDKDTLASPKDRTAYFDRACQRLLESAHGTIATKRKKGIQLRLQHVVYNTTELYLVIELTNSSGINFDIDYLEIYLVNGNLKRKASSQLLPANILYKYKMPNSVLHRSSQSFVYVLPKYVLGDNEKWVLELKERNGGRKVKLSWK